MNRAQKSREEAEAQEKNWIDDQIHDRVLRGCLEIFSININFQSTIDHLLDGGYVLIKKYDGFNVYKISWANP